MRTIDAARDKIDIGVDATSLSRFASLWAAEGARLRSLHDQPPLKG